jgi:hypothetical protein
MQLFEVDPINAGLERDCAQFGFKTKPITNEIFFIVVLAVLATFMGVLSLKLYRQFGWSIYKKIGGDFKMQRKFTL